MIKLKDEKLSEKTERYGIQLRLIEVQVSDFYAVINSVSENNCNGIIFMYDDSDTIERITPMINKVRSLELPANLFDKIILVQTKCDQNIMKNGHAQIKHAIHHSSCSCYNLNQPLLQIIQSILNIKDLVIENYE